MFQPLAAVLKLDGLSTFLATKTGLFTVVVITVVLAGYLVSLGMEGYAKVQKYCFYIGIGVLSVVAVMLFGSHSGFLSAFNRESLNLFGTKEHVHPDDPGGPTTEAIVPKLGFSPFFGNRCCCPVPLLLDPVAELGRDAVRRGPRRGDFKRVMSGMMWGLWGPSRSQPCSSCSRASSSGGSSSTGPT